MNTYSELVKKKQQVNLSSTHSHLILDNINIVVGTWSLLGLFFKMISQWCHIEVITNTIATAKLPFAEREK